MMKTEVFSVVLMLWLRGLGVASFNLTISPEHVAVNNRAQSVTFTCSADVALAGCQVRWLDHRTKAGPLLELSRGPEFQADLADLAHLDAKWNVIGYSYIGRGLGAGDCGVSLQIHGHKEWIVACRARTENGGWKYAWSEVYAPYHSHYASSWVPLPHTLATRREQVVLPGGEARILMKAGKRLDNCYFDLQGLFNTVYFNKGHRPEEETGRHHSFGAGWRSGECGITITNITEEDNGPIKGVIRPETLNDNKRSTVLVVARPPTAPTLSLVRTGSNVTATCEVPESRPVANISWVLGDTVIREDNNDDTQATAQTEWWWPWMARGISQTVTLQLNPQYDGENLKCVVSHVALDQALITSERLPPSGSTTTTSSLH